MEPRKDYQAALAFRLQGKTYGEIRNVFKIPKSTLSSWFSDLRVGNKAQKRLESKKKNGYYKLVEFNKLRTENIKKENEEIRKSHESRIIKLSNRELMILGAALYWGEGYKNFRAKKGTYPYMSFGNSDPLMIKTFIVFLEKFLKISKDRIKCQIMIYPNIMPERAVHYWKNVTQIPARNFRTQMTVSRASQGKRPWNMLPFGTLQLRVSRRQEFFKIKGLIDGVIKAVQL